MIAEVYPLTRLPRGFTFFDYDISNIKANIGDIIKINFKHRKIMGIIRNIKPISEHKTNPILAVISTKFFSIDDIARLELIAKNIAQSPSSVFYTTLYGFRNKIDILKIDSNNRPKLTINKITAEQISKTIEQIKRNDKIFAQMNDAGAFTLAYTLSKQFKNQILIIVPHERDVKLINQLFQFNITTGFLYGKISAQQRNAIINNWQTGKIKTLISTRQGSLLPAKKIDAIVILHSSSKDHKNWNSNPRYDARLASELLADQHSSKLIFTDFTPSTKNIFQKIPIVWNETDETLNNIQLINLISPTESSKIPMISATLKNSISETLKLNKRILLVYNRKGVAKRLQCQECKHIPFCGTCGANPIVRVNDLICPICKTEMWIPKICPACGSSKLKPRGIGNKRIQSELQKIFTNNTIAIIDKQNTNNLSADILIVTEFFFQAIKNPFTKKQFGLIADLSIDLSLGNDFDSSEITAQKIHRLNLFAQQQNAKCIIQTWIIDTIKEMVDIKKFLKQEIDIRKKYMLFPIYETVSILPAGKKSESMIKFSVNSNEIIENSISKKTQESLIKTPNSYKINTNLREYK